MKFFKFFYIFFLCLPFLIFTYLKPTVYDGTSTIVYKTSNIVLRGSDTANGEVLFKGGITVFPNAGAKLNITTPLFGPIDLRLTGSLDLQNDLVLDSLTTLSNGGIIRGGGHSIFLTGDLTIPASTIFTFTGNTIIDGLGHDLIIGKYAQLFLEGGISVTFRNMTIRDVISTVATPQIRCADWYSNVCFDNVIFAFNDDFVFRNGQFFIHNDVEFTGTSKFSYRSVRPSYIEQHSNLIFSPNTTFEYYPSSTTKSLIKMMDKTSAIIFDGSTLQTTATGIRLTVGSLYFDNKVTLSSMDNTLTYSISKRTLVETTAYQTFSLAWSPDGQYLVLGNDSQASRLYSFNGNSFTYLSDVNVSPYPTVRSVAWSPNGKYLVLGCFGAVNQLYRFNGSSFTLLSSISAANTQSVAWSPDGKYLAVGNDGQSKIYRFTGNSFVFLCNVGSSYSTFVVAWRPDGKYLVLGNGAQASTIYNFNGITVSNEQSFGGAADQAVSVAWSPDGNFLVAGNQNAPNKLYVFSGNSLSFVQNVDATTFATRSVQWSPDGKYFAMGNANVTSNLYRFNGNSFTLLYNIDPTNPFVWSVSWRPDGKYLALGTYANQSRFFQVSARFDTSPQGFVNGIIFGNSAIGSGQDLDVNLMSGANVQIYGQFWYDNSN